MEESLHGFIEVEINEPNLGFLGLIQTAIYTVNTKVKMRKGSTVMKYWDIATMRLCCNTPTFITTFSEVLMELSKGKRDHVYRLLTTITFHSQSYKKF